MIKDTQEFEVSVLPQGQMKSLKEKLERIEEKLNQISSNFQSKNPDELLTKKETAKLLKVSDSSIWLWTKKGKLKAHYLQGRVYYKREEVLSALTSL